MPSSIHPSIPRNLYAHLNRRTSSFSGNHPACYATRMKMKGPDSMDGTIRSQKLLELPPE